MSEQAPEPPHSRYDRGHDGGGAPSRQAPSLIQNRVSLAGAGIAVLVLVNILFLLLVAGLAGRENPYIGILAYLILPAVMLLGLLLVPLGVILERRRRRGLAPEEVPAYPRIDFNSRTVRHRFLFSIGLTLFFIMLSAAGSYHAYQFTDTVAFCGLTCHTPMRPEFTAYRDSPHARVSCVSCHVGPGAAWYVRSKLTGVYQVYAVLAGVYPRPITTPVKGLRPVREACEQCHWPQKFYGGQLKTFTHFAYDRDNTQTRIQMIIKTGGGAPELGRAGGIHWHMNIANRVWFIATDKQHQNIPWVKVITRQGRVTIYREKGAKLAEKDVGTMPKHLMDCVTCHDRPSHRFRPPDEAVDEGFLAGQLDRSLPFLKKEVIAALTKAYPTTESALEGIATSVDVYYRNNYPQIYESKHAQIGQAIATAQRIYTNNIFPYMRVDWRTHPDNIGHLYYRGCFRCHDGKHVSDDGRVISRECGTCHAIVRGNIGVDATSSAPSQPFEHPIDLSALKAVPCDTCHTGAGL